jgi:protein PhnA
MRPEYSHEDGDRYVCPECAHEWPKEALAEIAKEVRVVRDANGNERHDGDAVTETKISE